MSDEDLRSLELSKLLPHAPPMLLIDRIERARDDEIAVSALIQEDNIFLSAGRVRGAVLVEYMAQTVATFAGLEASKQAGPIRPGYVIGIRSFEVKTEALRPGEALQIIAVRIFGDADRANFNARVERDSQTIATATMTVYRGALNEGDKS